MGGHPPSIAKAALGVVGVMEVITTQLLGILNEECSKLCHKRAGNPFRTIPVEKLADFKWETMIAELQSKAPLLFKILYCLTSRNDGRNTTKVGAAHYPGICSAASILLKERNREMCGLQSLVSLLLYSCHSEKQVCKPLLI